jgi:hypothetical protein
MVPVLAKFELNMLMKFHPFQYLIIVAVRSVTETSMTAT